MARYFLFYGDSGDKQLFYILKKKLMATCGTSIIPAFRTLRKEYPKFKVNLEYAESTYQKLN